VALDAGRGSVRSFRLDRIRAARPTGGAFEPPADFRLEEYARGEPFRHPADETFARVRFRGPSARWIREIAEAGTVEDDGDESVWQAPLGRPEGFAAFLLGLGADFVVEAPDALASAVRDLLVRVRDAHR
jgi:predicted DNA-binding transcriptional regulator YafY